LRTGGAGPTSGRGRDETSRCHRATYSIASAQSERTRGSYTVIRQQHRRDGDLERGVLTVNTPVAPAITTQPQSLTVNAGATASFTVRCDGLPAPAYQWQKGGPQSPGATAATYTIGTVQSGDAGSYTVVVSNTSGSVTSNAAVLTVAPSP